jgi:FMN phosphatase YigB (HAD superfamily)
MDSRIVFFDLGNVLVNFDHQIAVDQLAQKSGCSSGMVQQVVFDSGLQNRYETGLVSSDEFAGEVNQRLERQIPVPEILEAISAIFEPNHAILPALGAVQAAGVPMGLLSNTCEAHWQWVAAQGWPVLGEWFRYQILSYQVQSMKPDGRIYQACEEQSGCSGPAIFFTDDREENVAAAAARGWTTCHFQSVAELVERLHEWLHAD